MDRIYFRYVVVLMMAATTGCAMCDSSQDGAYGAFGGRWQRTDPFRGRVGSAIDPAGVDMSNSQSTASIDPTESDDGRHSILRTDGADELDSETTDALESDATLIDEPADGRSEVLRADQPTVGDDLPVVEVEPDDDQPAEDLLPERRSPEEGLPDLFKDLGLDPNPAASSSETDDDLPPLRADGDR